MTVAEAAIFGLPNPWASERIVREVPNSPRRQGHALSLVNVEPGEQPFLKLLDDLGAAFETLAGALDSATLRREEPGVWHFDGRTHEEGDDGWV